MQQQPYRPPNVAGWEGGTSWLNTNTVMGRFDMVVKAQYLKYSNYYSRCATQLPARRRVRGGGGGLRARLRVRRPAVARGGNALGADRLGATAATNTATARRQRFYALQAMILGGPDGQVM